MAKSIEEWQVIIKKLEGVMKTSPNEEQRIRVFRQIKEAKLEISKIQGDSNEGKAGSDDGSIDFTDDPSAQDKKESPAAESKHYELIQTSGIQPVHPLSESDDINFVASSIVEFENEYWGVLSDYHLTLDYAHSNKRDAFLNILENIKRGIKEYTKILDQMGNTPREEFKKQLQTMALKQERAVIMETVDFFHDMKEFLDMLISDYNNHGNIIMNPSDPLEFDKLYGEKKLNHKTVIEGITLASQFLEETLDHVKLPRLFSKKGKPK